MLMRSRRCFVVDPLEDRDDEWPRPVLFVADINEFGTVGCEPSLAIHLPVLPDQLQQRLDRAIPRPVVTDDDVLGHRPIIAPFS